jgi:aminopeptidase N
LNAQSNIDVLHYRYDIELSDKNDTLSGWTTITCVVVQNTSELSLDLQGLNKNKGMIVTAVQFGLLSAELPGFSQKNNKLIISRDYAFKKGDTITINIFYKGIPDDGLIISKNKYGDKTFFADNWPNRAHHWIPCIDDPADKASFEFIVTAPSPYRVISNGTKTEEKETGDGKKLTHWKEDISLSTKVMVIGVSRFAVKTFEDSPPGIPVSAWVYPQDSLPGFRNYSVAPSILKFLTRYIGPYPYEKLANVQSKTIFGGMENASAIFYEETSASLFQNIESLLAHEIAHQWFGDMASEKSFPHLWLSEGFATYLTHIYIESKYGADSLNQEMKNDRGDIIEFVKGSDRPVVDSVSPLMGLLNANSYQKGGWILHMLRRQLGDTIFHNIIKSYYAMYAGKNADTRDFQKVCEKESGKDLHVFFDQWLYSPGLPKLDVEWNYDEKNKKVSIKVKQLQNNSFQFPLGIKMQGGSGKIQLETLNVTSQDQQFLLPAKERPAQISLDPSVSLLFEGSARSIK